VAPSLPVAGSGHFTALRRRFRPENLSRRRVPVTADCAPGGLGRSSQPVASSAIFTSGRSAAAAPSVLSELFVPTKDDQDYGLCCRIEYFFIKRLRCGVKGMEKSSESWKLPYKCSFIHAKPAVSGSPHSRHFLCSLLSMPRTNHPRMFHGWWPTS